jgi:phage repressor protein C with HTH and peptisase S24 domain
MGNPAMADVRLAHHKRTSSVRQSHSQFLCENRILGQMDSEGILEALKRLGVPHSEIAEAIGRDRTAATKMLGGTRSIKANEIQKLEDLVAKWERIRGDADVLRRLDDFAGEHEAALVRSYVAVEVLPTFAGAGGGGTGDGERQMALLPRRLVENDLRAQPEDLLVINIRGNSMEPVFYQDDQILVDRRDQDTQHPGPFAMRYVGEDGWVIKNVERVPRTNRLRIWSENAGFGDREEEAEYVQIAGRPVWFARRV